MQSLNGCSSNYMATAYLAACECELEALKPGNVSIYSDGHDMTVDDFRRSAKASAPFLADSRLSLGEKIYYAIEATQREVGCNTNLGIVLLAAPLMEATQTRSDHGDLRSALRSVLNQTTQNDADWVYKAIRLAKPGGLGESDQEDVHSTPQVSLTEAMGFAAERDRIAYQYVSDYQDIFTFALKRYRATFKAWGDSSWAAVAVFVSLLKRFPDSHIVRKYGNRYDGMVRERMSVLEEELSRADRPTCVLGRLQETDAAFKSLGINPGTTADLTVGCLLAVNLELLFPND